MEEAGGAESVSAMDHDSRDSIKGIITLFAELTLIFVDKVFNKFVDILSIRIFDVLRLLEKVGCWVLQFFH